MTNAFRFAGTVKDFLVNAMMEIIWMEMDAALIVEFRWDFNARVALLKQGTDACLIFLNKLNSR
jgi:hypothetical protein